MDLLEAIYFRRAIRSYADGQLDDATIEKLIDAAIRAPSAMNKQPWTFTVVRDRKIMAHISREAKRHVLRNTSAGLIPDSFHATLESETFDIFYGAPALVVICGPATDPWTIVDCSLAAQNFMLAAHGRGLGSCWIGFAQGWLETNEGKATIGLAPDRKAVAPLIVGRPLSQSPQVERRVPEIRWS